MSLRIALSIFVWELSLVPIFAQPAAGKDPCHAIPAEGSMAAKNFLSFDRFDKELRAALTKQDAVALAFLITFPLRVNDAGGTISLDNAAALKTHFQEVFTPAVRKEILSENFSDLVKPYDVYGCPDEGIGYRRGVIWVNASERGYAISAVNRDWVPPYPVNKWWIPKIEYVCQTETHRIAIETLTGRTLRYRSWNKPRSVAERPDLEILKGDGTFEGTNVCAYPVYTFRSGTAVYRVAGGLGCWGDAEGAPKEATGQLEVTVADKQPISSWCY